MAAPYVSAEPAESQANGIITSRLCSQAKTRSGTPHEQHRNAMERTLLSLLTDRRPQNG